MPLHLTRKAQALEPGVGPRMPLGRMTLAQHQLGRNAVQAMSQPSRLEVGERPLSTPSPTAAPTFRLAVRGDTTRIMSCGCGVPIRPMVIGSQPYRITECPKDLGVRVGGRLVEFPR